jgi:hypothetical protein
VDGAPATILVVCNREDAPELVSALDGTGTVASGDGGDDTFRSFVERRPEVVVVTAALDAGDARALIGALRAEAPPGSFHVVLIGDARGPIRNALDAADFAADRFVARPVAAKALRFAVTAGITLARRGRGDAEAPAAVPAPVLPDASVTRVTGAQRAVMIRDGSSPGARRSSSRLDTALDEGIEDVVRDEVVRRTSGGFAVPAEAILAAGGSLDEPAPEVTAPMSVHDVPTRPVSVPPPPPPAAFRPPRSPRAAPPSPARDLEPAGLGEDSGSHALPPGIEAPVLTDTEGSFDRTDTPAPAAADDDDWAPAMPVREPTLILSPGTPAPEPVGLDVTERRDGWTSTSSLTPLADDGTDGSDRGGAAAAAAEVDAEVEDDLASDLADLSVSRPVPAPPPPSGGDFARELRRKMSLMAQRLFRQTDAPATPQVDVRPPHDFRTEIDLASIDSGERPVNAEDYDLNVDATFAGDDHGLPTGGLDDDRRAAAPATGTTTRTAETGDLVRGSTDAAALIARMFAHEFTGRIVFYRGPRPEVEKVIYFDGGRPVFASSDQPEDRMGELLYREGKITREQYERSRDVVFEQGRRMGEILVDRGFLKRRELLPAVRRHVEDIIYSLFGWESGEYRIVPGDGASAERIRLSRHPAAMVLEGIRRKLDLGALERLLGPPTTVVEIGDRDKAGTVISVADLSVDERAALQALDGSVDLGHVARTSGAGLAAVYQLAWALTLLGIATVRRRGGDDDDAPALVGETDLAIDRERVRGRHRLVAEADYFALLGVRRDATAFEIRRAYEGARRDFDAEAFPPELRTELGVELAEIGAVLEEAYRVLRDDVLRHEYLENLSE